MKKLEFETNRQKWIVTDIEVSKGFVKIDGVLYEKVVKLSDITENQASDVVETATCFHSSEKGYINYMNDVTLVESAIKSLHSLIESKGFYLFENPFTKTIDENYSKNNRILFEQSESKTLYNPYLFKIKN